MKLFERYDSFQCSPVVSLLATCLFVGVLWLHGMCRWVRGLTGGFVVRCFSSVGWAVVGAVALGLGMPGVRAADGFRVAPKLELAKTLSGPAPKDLTWEALSGNVVVVEFWATWCAPCVAAIPHWNALADSFAGKPVRFLSITGDDEAVVRRFLHRRPIHGWVGLDADGATSAVYGGGGIPRTVIVDANGRIAAITSPGRVTEQVIHDVLAGKPLELTSPRADEQVPAVPGRTGTEEVPPLLEVVVRRSTSNRRHSTSGQSNLDAVGWSVRTIVAYVQDEPEGRVVVPKKLSDRRYDVTLRWTEIGRVEPRVLLGQLLTSAFGVTTGSERREIDVYVLSAPDAKGLKMARTVMTGPASYSSQGDGLLSSTNRDMPALARSLESVLGQPVLDETKLSGGFDWNLKFDQDKLGSVLAAVRDQLGLSIVKARRRVEFVVVAAE